MHLIEKYTLPGVQRLIHQLMDIEGLSPMALAKQAGVHFTTLYGILKRHDNLRSRPVRRATIMALGINLGYEVRFDSHRNEITFTRPDIKPSNRDDIDDLLREIRLVVIRSGKRQLEKTERERIVNVVGALIR